MGIMHQLGDPVCPDCLCQHHGAEYGGDTGFTTSTGITPKHNTINNGAAIASAFIALTETCCVVVNAAIAVPAGTYGSDLEIEQPVGTVVTTQEDEQISGGLTLIHIAAWEILTPGNYTYRVINRKGIAIHEYAAWIKVVASDCEG